MLNKKSLKIFLYFTLSLLPIAFSGLFTQSTHADQGYILIYMDDNQTNHLKAYGWAYHGLTLGLTGEWLLNYRGGSFLYPAVGELIDQAILMNISYELINENQKLNIYREIEEGNMERIELTKPPEIAVYTPPGYQPWDDAVTLVLTYAEIPYTTLWDREVLDGVLEEYDWLHLHHEDFTGQYGKFYASYRNSDWYIQQVHQYEEAANEAGYNRVADHKLAVAQTIQQYVVEGGFLFAMCSATDTIDVALAAQNVDIVAPEIDGTPITPNFADQLNFDATFAFTDFEIYTDPYLYEYSSIDVDVQREGLRSQPDYFQLFEFSAKIDPIPTMLTQCHTMIVKGFLGQTTEYYREYIKPYVTILGEVVDTNRVKYIHGNYGEGTFTFYAGHDPEDYQHLVGDPPTELARFPNSPGYRLILNNVLFPAAKKEKQKT